MPVQYRDMEQENIQWHPAFIEAIQMELEAYGDSLEFIPEFQLTTGPLRIDCVVVKKARDVVIKKNIAAMFREVNLLEYKSPDDYISVEDFYKVYGYACLYASLEKVPVTSLTISFVESRYPRSLLTYLKEKRGYKVEKTSPGIYTVRGDVIPIQVIDCRRLSAGENSWLKDLCNSLGPMDWQRIFGALQQRQGKAARVKAWLDATTKANNDSLQEAIKMSSSSLTVEQILEEAGFYARAEERKSLKIAQNFIDLGYPLEDIASATQLDLEKVKGLCREKAKEAHGVE